MSGLSCAFTGHRPQRYSFGFDEAHADCGKLKLAIATQIAALAMDGFTVFYTGMAQGADIWCAESVLALREHTPELRLIAALPYDRQAKGWTAAMQERYHGILVRCDEVVYVSREYKRGCLFQRDRWLVDNADMLLAVYDGKPKGGTAYTVSYAKKKGKQVVVIDPDFFTAAPL